MTQMNMMSTECSRKILLHHNYQRHLRSILFVGAEAFLSFAFYPSPDFIQFNSIISTVPSS